MVPALRYPTARRSLHRRLGDAAAKPRREHWRGAFLDHLLVPPLHGTFALEQMHDVSVAVGEDLHLDVPRPLDEALDVERAVAEGRRRLSPRVLHGVGDLIRVHDAAHALAAAASRRLDQRGKTHAGRWRARMPSSD